MLSRTRAARSVIVRRPSCSSSARIFRSVASMEVILLRIAGYSAIFSNAPLSGPAHAWPIPGVVRDAEGLQAAIEHLAAQRHAGGIAGQAQYHLEFHVVHLRPGTFRDIPITTSPTGASLTCPPRDLG